MTALPARKTYRFHAQVRPEALCRFYREVFRWSWDNFSSYRELASRRKAEVIAETAARLNVACWLDAGGGSGLLSERLKEMGSRVVVCDLNLDLLAAVQANKDLPALAAADLSRLPFRRGSFAGIVCSEVLEHLPDDTPALAELYRVLKPGGVLLFTAPHLHCYDGLDGWCGLVSRTVKSLNHLSRKLGRREPYPFGVNTHLIKRTPTQWRRSLSRFFTVEKMLPIFISPYIPEAASWLKRLELWVYEKKEMFTAQGRIEKQLRCIYPFSHLGQLQLYVCRKDRR